MSELQGELAGLRSMRRRVMLQLVIATGMAPLLFARLWDAELVLVDTRWLAAIAVALLSWAAVRTVADVAAVLEEPCPACYELFFGGLSRAAAALPVPPSECVHCRIGFDGERTQRKESGPSLG
ncbi:MAG: hypothetical protein JRH17_09630 [Deltaproteobacteria bacterium]|nr:hypothetical protein [Deltaproteobacteria bacterium]